MTNPLERLADRARHEPYFLAAQLEAFAVAAGLDDAGLCAALGCPAGELARLRLCRAPRDPAAGFREDVEAIARRFGLDPAVLAKAVKSARAAARLRDAVAAPEQAGYLMAARDRDESPP